ncbi:hypothetical protein WDU94_000345 [Cyamophila willieti]
MGQSESKERENYERGNKDCMKMKTKDCKECDEHDQTKDCSNFDSDKSECNRKRSRTSQNCGTHREQHRDIEEIGNEYCKETRNGNVGCEIIEEEQDIGGTWHGSCETEGGGGGRECLWTKKSNEEFFDREKTGEIVGDMVNSDSNAEIADKTNAKIVETSEEVMGNDKDMTHKTEKSNDQISQNDKRIDKSSETTDDGDELCERIEKRKSIREKVDNARDESSKKTGESTKNTGESKKNTGESMKNTAKSTKNTEKSNIDDDKDQFDHFKGAASAMEMSLIGAKNVALLVYKDIIGNRDNE